MAQPLLPVFLKLAGRRVLVVGSGGMAAAKAEALRAAGAHVTVVERAFVPADVDGVWLVVAAATPEVNRAVVAAAEARRVFVNAVDDPDAATAYMGGVLRKGGVTVAVSTEGAAPALAGLLREGLEAVLPDDLADWVATARSLRRRQREAGVAMAERRPLLLDALDRLYGRRRGSPS